MNNPDQTISLPTEEDARAFAHALAEKLRPGQPLLLSGPVGAGKSFVARAIIQHLMASNGRIEDIPSPTFTLVQVYDLPVGDVWHCDLYRLSDPQEIIELGLDEAMETEICLIEWPERMGELVPQNAWLLKLDYQSEGRVARFTAPVDLEWERL